MKNIFITGATSRYGAYLLATLLRDTDSRVWIMVRRKDGELDLAGRVSEALAQVGFPVDLNDYRGRFRIVKGDLVKNQLGVGHDMFAEMREEGIDEIFHLASLHTERYLVDIEDISSINIDGTLRVLNFARGVHAKAFNYMGMLYCVGKTEDVITEEHFPEESFYRFNNVVEFSKQLAEKVTIEFCRENGMGYRILRPGLMLDPDNFVNVEHTWYYYVFKSLLRIMEVRTETNGNSYFLNNPFEFSVRDIDLYFATPAYVADVFAAVIAEGSGTLSKTFHVFDKVVGARHIFSLLAEVLGLPRISLVDDPDQLPKLERRAFSSSFAFLEYLLQDHTFQDANTRALRERAGIHPGDLSDERLRAVGRACVARARDELSVVPTPSLWRRMVRRYYGYSKS